MTQSAQTVTPGPVVPFQLNVTNPFQQNVPDQFSNSLFNPAATATNFGDPFRNESLLAADFNNITIQPVPRVQMYFPNPYTVASIAPIAPLNLNSPVESFSNPEPGTWGLIAGGLGLLAVVRARRRRQI